MTQFGFLPLIDQRALVYVVGLLLVFYEYRNLPKIDINVF